VEGTVEKKDGLINVRAKGFVSLRQKNGQKDLTLPRR